MKAIIVIAISLFCTLAAQSQMIYNQTTSQYHNVDIEYGSDNLTTVDVRIRDYATGNIIKGQVEKDSSGYSGRLRDNQGHGYAADINESGRVRLRQTY